MVYFNDHVRALRELEFETFSAYFKPRLDVLEIGGRDGFQASLMAKRACRVTSIDITRHKGRTFYPVQIYDGKNLPVADTSVDVVFTSNVLPHVRDLENLFAETHRVCRPTGIVIHVVPSATWRLSTSLSYFCKPFAFTRAKHDIEKKVTKKLERRKPFARGIRIPLLAPLGERGNALSELYHFSRRGWRQLFERNGFEIVKTHPTHLFYTGHAMLPEAPMSWRRRLAGTLGSACHVFVMRPVGKEGNC